MCPKSQMTTGGRGLEAKPPGSRAQSLSQSPWCQSWGVSEQLDVGGGRGGCCESAVAGPWAQILVQVGATGAREGECRGHEPRGASCRPRWSRRHAGGACPYAWAGERVSVALRETEGKGDSHTPWTSRATENPLHHSWCVERGGMAERQREGGEMSFSRLDAACGRACARRFPLRTREPPHQTKTGTPHLQKRLRRRNSESLVQGSTAREGLGVEGELGSVRPRVSL